MTITTTGLLTELSAYVNQHLEETKRFQQEEVAMLNHKTNTNTWSVLECFEHLNRYGNFYLPEIEQQIGKSRYPAANHFTSGLLGNYFANSMLPKAKLNKMKTFSSMDPNNSTLDNSVLDRFLAQQYKLLSLLQGAATISLNRTKTGISITRLIKLKLGDTLRVVIYHNERHIQQAKRALALARA